MPYRLKPNSWQPSRMRWTDHTAIMVALIVVAYVRGFDYLIGEDQWAAKDFMIAAAPEWVWGGVGFVAGATILSFGVTTKRHLLVYIGHGWLMAAYGLNALALVLASGPTYALPLVGAASALVIGASLLIHRLTKVKNGIWAFLLLLATVAVGAAGMMLSNSFDGVRGGGAVGIVAMLHFIHMIRTGGRPLRPETGVASEKVVDGGHSA